MLVGGDGNVSEENISSILSKLSLLFDLLLILVKVLVSKDLLESVMNIIHQDEWLEYRKKLNLKNILLSHCAASGSDTSA